MIYVDTINAYTQARLIKDKRLIEHIQALIVYVCIGVLRHMLRYFSDICDDTYLQADWRSYTNGRAPNSINIS